MQNLNDTHEAADQAAPATGGDAWVKPEVTRIRAGDAEFGATPLVPEGAFGFGS